MAVIGFAAASVSVNMLRHFPLLSSSSSSKAIDGLVLKEKYPERFVAGSMSVRPRFGSSKGGSTILERPTFNQPQFDPSTQTEAGGDIGWLRDRKGTGSGDSYRVLLIDDPRHTEKLVVKALPQAVPSVTPDDARRLFHGSRENGVAVVIVTVKEHAEFYSQMMTRWGLHSKIEPNSYTV